MEIQSPNSKSKIPNLRPSIVEGALLVLILSLATVLRLWRLDEIPPGFTHDEAGHGHDAAAILHGARPIYETVGYGREPLYDYWIAGLMVWGGPSGRVLRFSPVPLGLMTLLVSYAWVRLAFGRPVALAATALQAASFWSLATARQALRSGLLPVLFTMAVYFFWRGWGEARQAEGIRVKGMPFALPRGGEGKPGRGKQGRDKQGRDKQGRDKPGRGKPGRDKQGRDKQGRDKPCPYGMMAVLMGAMLCTYLPARGMWVVFPVSLAYLAVWHRATFRRVWLPTLGAIALGWLLAAPMFVWLWQHPGAEQRLAMLDAPLEALRRGDPSVVLSRAWDGLCAFFFPGRGDDFLAYTIPGRPFFDPLTGALFLAGVVLCLARWREPARAFALIWFAIGISPTLLTGASAATTRSIAALPVAFLFPALAVEEAARRLKACATGIWATFAVFVVVSGFLSARDYFVRWGESPDVRAAYQHTLIEAAHYLDAQPEDGVVAVSTIYPLAPHDPYIFEMSVGRRDLDLRWFDGRRALLIPAEATARLVAPSSATLDPYFADLPGLRVRERVMMRADDLDPFFAVYDWRPEETLAALRARVERGPAEPALPADFGGVLQLVGYDLYTPTIAPGGTVELLTLWQVIGQPAGELVLFTHALDATGSVAGQEDRLDAPSWDWQAGDVIGQLHRFTLPADRVSGPLVLEVGVYTKADLVRLPVWVNGVIAGDRVLLQMIEVQAP